MPQSSDPCLYWFALQTVPNIGNVRFNTLVKRFGSAQAALDASPKELGQLPDFGEKVIHSLKSEVDYEGAEEQMLALDKWGARMVTVFDSEYPKRLKEIYDPPPFLLVKGEIQERDDHAVAIVGSRVCTSYGKQITEQLTQNLCEAGMTIVSGLARGIDSIAHRAAMKCGGRTIGVLGCGLDVIYPPENKELYDEIAHSGAIISEFFFGVKPEKFNFPSRNRIISGLSRGVVVVEAGKASGALSTAHHAMDQNREVFAVPGNISSASSAGTNELLKQGAILVTQPADVLLALGFHPDHKNAKVEERTPDLPEDQKIIYNSLTTQPQQIDMISKVVNRPVSEVLSLLFNLEMAGLVRQSPGKLFSRST